MPPRYEGDNFWINLLYFSDRVLELFAEHFASLGLCGFVTYRDKGCPKECSGEIHLDLITGMY